MTRVRPLLPARETVALFALVFVVFASYLRVFADSRFYFDSANYWALGGTFGRAGHFSLLDFDSTIRGYALPLYERLLSAIASPLGMGSSTIVQLAGALQIAFLGIVLIPALVRADWPTANVSPITILALNAILFIFWRDHLAFPLSDFPAVTLGVGALLAVSRRSPAGYAIAGVLVGLAWNVRQAYLVMIIVVLILVLVRAGVRRTPLRAGAAAGLLLVGVLFASLPQILINHRHADSWSPTVRQTRLIAMINLTQGMKAQRYETYVGTEKRSPSVLYLDPSTEQILRSEHIRAFTSYTRYLGLAVDYPTGMVVAWTRRIFNGLDIRYATPYVHGLSHSEWFSLLNYTILFAAAVRLLAPAFRRRLGAVCWADGLALCSATVTAVPLAAESRYYLPVYLVLYSIVVFAPGTRQALTDLGRPAKITLGVLYPVFLFLCVALSTTTVPS